MRAGAAAGLLLLLVGVAHAVVSLPLVLALPPAALVLNALLLCVEVLLVAFAALLLHTLRRPALPAPAARAPAGDVDVLVPVRNEDPRVLRDTLQAALVVDAPRADARVRVLVVDDSDVLHADDARAVCDALGVAYLRREQRRGYKAGALNDALARTSAPFVAVLDVDHQPERDFLQRAVAHLAPGIAYVQTVLAWRNADTLLRRLAALLQLQFYHSVQLEKGSRERAVFTGSGTVFRREALASVGGFPEQTLVEDFDLTLRLTAAGWRGRFSPHVGARGLLPWTARDLAKQLWRWSHGTTEAVRLRAREVLASKRAPLAPRLELLLDGCAYLAGGAIVAAALLLVAASLIAAPLPRALDGWSLLLAPLAVALAHVASAAHALRNAGARGYRLLPLYHIVSLAFTPVLLVSSLAALFGAGRGFEGRVAKARASGARRSLRVGVASTVILGGLAVAAALAGALPLPAAGWVGLLGVSFAATVATAWPNAAPAPE